MAEKAILIGVIPPEQNKNQAEEYLEELAFLAKTAGAIPIKKITQKLAFPNNKTFIGKGKIEEVKQLAKQDPESGHELEQHIPAYINNNFEIANDASSMGIKGGKLKNLLDGLGMETLRDIAKEADAKKIQQMQAEQQHQQQQQMMAQIPQQMAQGQLG